MPDQPTGTVTFLFTDIEGSTTRWEHQRQAMQQALARHDAILRAVIAAHGGHVFKTVGDAFYAVFAAAPDALHAALAAQRAFEAEAWPAETGPLRVRMALHTGATEQRDGDYFGPPLNRVARLLAAGHGGQVLISAATQELVRDQLPLAAALRSLGEHRLRDLIRPEHIFQLLAPDLAGDFPPLRTLENRPNNLPLQPTPFLGRERELAALGTLLRTPSIRLLTVTGPGGTGKTRLALQAAADALDHFADGVWFVNLAPIGDPMLVVSTIAHVLVVHETGQQSLVDLLKHHLRDKALLLLLDNFEQVLGAAPAVADLLGVAPRLTVLVTSRAPLRLRGEHEYSVPPFAVPDPRHLPALAALTQYDAVRLFIARAQEVRADFAVTNANAPAVAEICVRLDGLPLAIELAAARVRLFSPPALLARLGSRLTLLTGGARDQPARHQTLRGAIDWSYSLLQSDEQILFARLAVFLGGRTFEAIEAVCNPEGGLDVLAGVESLVEKSLLRQEEGPGGEPRLVMLETIHEYARERLELSGEVENLRQRHAAYFLQMAEAAEGEFMGPHQAAALARLAPEQDNVRAALTWVLERREGETALRLAGAFGHFWNASGQLIEGRQWLEAALAMTQPAQAAVPDAGSAGAARAKALHHAAWAAQLQGDFEAARLRVEAALALNRARADTPEIAWSLNMLAMIAGAEGDFATAGERSDEALALQRELGDPSALAAMLNNEGWRAYVAGDDARALPLLEESLALHRQVGDTSRRLGLTLDSLGKVLIERGDHARARALLTEGLRLAQHYGSKRQLQEALDGLAWLAAPEGMARGAPGEGAERAARLFGAAEALREACGEVLSPPERSVQEHHVAIAQVHLDEAAWQAAWAAGRAMPLEQAVAYALEDTATFA
ncbi:MAG TPA: adenylate/guanylate cyclase domain-containing protein [Herpetosiphonaceae bacterium]|nr:adenylate/guanylate cyclase domain-containing protein [Herpetosiphonaceae bacterium]